MKEVQGRRGKSSPSDATESRKKAPILTLGLGAGIPSPRRQLEDFPIPREPYNHTTNNVQKKTPVHPDNMSTTSNTMDPYSKLHCNSITDRQTRQNIIPSRVPNRPENPNRPAFDSRGNESSHICVKVKPLLQLFYSSTLIRVGNRTPGRRAWEKNPRHGLLQ
jgi:hypothetical protein